MLLLTSTSDLVKVVTGSAGTINVRADFVDDNAGTITPGRTNTATISSATTTTVVGSPASSTQRNVKALFIFNNDASVSNLLGQALEACGRESEARVVFQHVNALRAASLEPTAADSKVAGAR